MMQLVTLTNYKRLDKKVGNLSEYLVKIVKENFMIIIDLTENQE